MESTPSQWPPNSNSMQSACSIGMISMILKSLPPTTPLYAPRNPSQRLPVSLSAFCLLQPFTLHLKRTSRARASLGVLSPLVSLSSPWLMSKAISEYSYKTSKKKKSKQISVKAIEPRTSCTFLFIRQHHHGELRRSSHPHPQQT